MGLLGKLKDWMLGAPEDDELPEREKREVREDQRPDAPWDAGAGRVVVLAPTRFVDAGQIADHLCQGYTVLLNLEDVSKEASRRIIDFLSGSAYARNGQLLHVACNVYLLAPTEVDVLDFTADLPPEEEVWDYDDAFGF